MCEKKRYSDAWSITIRKNKLIFQTKNKARGCETQYALLFHQFPKYSMKID